MRRYFAGETIELTGEFRDKDNTLANPSVSRMIRIKDPDGARVVTDGVMLNEDTGQYYYPYATLATARLGKYTFEVIATDGAGNDVSIGAGEFEIRARTA